MHRRDRLSVLANRPPRSEAPQDYGARSNRRMPNMEPRVLGGDEFLPFWARRYSHRPVTKYPTLRADSAIQDISRQNVANHPEFVRKDPLYVSMEQSLMRPYPSATEHLSLYECGTEPGRCNP